MGKTSVHLIAAIALAACTRSTPPTADHAASSSASATPAPCGSAGGPCSVEGATCSPAPVGSGWSHVLSCRSGKWSELEIAPLPTN